MSEPLVKLGQGDFEQHYYPEVKDTETQVMRRTIAILQKRAGAVTAVAGLVGFLAQHQGPDAAAKELTNLGCKVDRLLEAMSAVAAGLEQGKEVSRFKANKTNG